MTKKVEEMFSEAKVGDRVWSTTKGWGEIIGIDGSSNYPLDVEYDSTGYDTFTFGGYLHKTHVMQSLFWGEIVINVPAKPLPKLVVDAKVIVWSNPEQKYKRHFSHFENGRIYTFDAGTTSFSKLHEVSTSSWTNWELVE